MPLPRLFLTLALLGACSQPQPPSPAAAHATPQGATAPSKPAADAKAPAPSEAPVTFADELAAWDELIASASARARTNASSPLAAEAVASAYMSRARLSGSYDDYAQAETWLQTAFAADPSGLHGPYLTRAQLDFTLHRLDRVDADFALAQRGRHDDVATSGHRLFAANLALQRGDIAGCGTLLEQSIQLHESVGNQSAKGFYELGLGHVEASEAAYARALSLYHGRFREPKAWLHLQLGLSDLSRGRWDEALAHYQDAQAQLRGWWLVDEHIAEVLALQGKRDEAAALYLDIIARTDNPEFMDAMAEILREQGRTDEAAQSIARARTRYEAQLRQYPEAAYGHALEHYLEFGDDPAFTLELAQKNHALRPGPDAKRLLARALLGAGQAAAAVRVIDEALATGWTTADLHVTAAQAHRAAGDTAAADAQLAKAKAIDPHASE
ncbi:MAG: tetratricopeptide repeat protein [Nannocystaceae bacterium]|nr:tetratricopeptide repeat protein [Nannocystaceae bacterium]